MIYLLKAALRQPITVLAALFATILFSILAIRKMPIDIFPTLGTPTIYVAQTFGGLSPQQVEGFIASYYEYHFLYITGIKYVDSKSIQGLSLLKCQFHEGTDMAQAMAEVVSYVNRARAFMPPNLQPPFIMRYDAGSVPVGQLTFSSEGRSLNEIQDLALFKVRPMFASLAGVSAPPPFGGNQRTVVVRADPERMRSYGLTPDELVTAIAKGNTLTPAGNLRVGDQMLITPQNTVVDQIKELENIPIKPGNGPAMYVRDVASVDNGADITTGYALINGKRSVYIPVTKRADASTWDVVQRIRKALPDMQAAIPDDIHVSYEFDQSTYVANSLRNLLIEGGLGAVLTGLMVLLFLRDRRSALIVVLTIPVALVSAVVGLQLTGQSLNVMTLGGLALAVGILVDEATVTIENIHRHLEAGQPKARAIADACREIARPKLLILLCVLAVFVPALFMTGVPGAMFFPLSLSVGFAMIASFVWSQTLVPVAANYFLKSGNHPTRSTRFERFENQYQHFTARFQPRSRLIIGLYLVLATALALSVYRLIGTEIFPRVDTGQFQVRLRLPAGTRVERTEDATKKVLSIVHQLAGDKNVAISSAFVGLQPQTYAISPIFLWTSGPHEAVLKVNLSPDADLPLDTFKEQLRAEVSRQIPGMQLSFEPADLVDQVMSLGANTPVEVSVQAKNLAQGRELAERLRHRMAGLSYLRDLQYGLPLDYPTLQITYDRVRAGQLGLTVDEVSRSVVAGTSSSRLTQPLYWLDKASGNSYQVQVEYPQFRMNSPDQLEQLPVASNTDRRIYLRDVADWKKLNTVGEYDRLNQQRYVTLTANLQGKDIGGAVRDLNQVIHNLGELPQGVKITLRGQAELLAQTLSELSLGLALAVVAIFLLLAAAFQSFGLSLVVLSMLPAVLAGALSLLFLTGNTLNIQSFMGCIMAIGVAVANAILLVTNAETLRQHSQPPKNLGFAAARSRLRPILMTSLAMIVGMIPMAIGLGEGGQQTAPLGIAVIGGLIASTVATLLVLPLLYQSTVGRQKYASHSLDPDDPTSPQYTLPPTATA
ncbi:efflux RND transporter permease subunit [Larkinella punicea]|uniref:AcrB/AcrD/AcrF family protein n=1 Tax=Larkinella punicea TaxID=2315727 RepID=A0A368JMV5_9BACT|nr:efflux RND transporter permease subunit [Larkinella punicea]RCR67471.1 AcrB/AcrD/AcrF family protein [Larkinella punicea]